MLERPETRELWQVTGGIYVYGPPLVSCCLQPISDYQCWTCMLKEKQLDPFSTATFIILEAELFHASSQVKKASGQDQPQVPSRRVAFLELHGVQACGPSLNPPPKSEVSTPVAGLPELASSKWLTPSPPSSARRGRGRGCRTGLPRVPGADVLYPFRHLFNPELLPSRVRSSLKGHPRLEPGCAGLRIQLAGILQLPSTMMLIFPL